MIFNPDITKQAQEVVFFEENSETFLSPNLF